MTLPKFEEKEKNTIDDFKFEEIKKLTINTFLGDCEPRSIPAQKTKELRYFVTVALPHKDKVKFNDKRIEYRQLRTSQQYLYLRSSRHLLDYISPEYMIIYEHCFSGDLHLHITCTYKGIKKDLRHEFMDFFKINYRNSVAVDIREIYDEEKLKEYLLEKDLKKYQTSVFPPDIKTLTIDDLII